MPNALDCPDDNSLRQLMLGQMSDAEAERLERHVARCDRCGQALGMLETDDALVETVRSQQSVVAEPQSAAVESLIERLKGLQTRPGGGPTCKGPPVAEESSSRTSAETPVSEPDEELRKDAADILSPAQGPDELGRLGPFRVLRVLGAGGMGVVFEAEDAELRRRVVLKVIRPSLAVSASGRQRFLREARAMAEIEHDRIISIYQIGEDRGILFLAMPLLRGETLEERLRDRKKLSLTEVLRVGREIAEGLAAAHGRGLIHRDIKPGNIWLEENTDRVKLLDFGLVHAIDGSVNLSGSGVVAGTPQYMAPEQVAGSAVDGRCDLFSLGCVLYRMTTGELPYQGANTLQVLRSLEFERPKPPRDLNPAIPRALNHLILQLLSRDPALRPFSADAVVQSIVEIERGGGGHPVNLVAAGDTITLGQGQSPRGRSFSSRRRLGFATAALIAVGIGGSWFGPAVYRFATNQGQLVIETDDRDVEVVVKQDGEKVQIVDTRTQREVTLQAGAYELELAPGPDGLRLSTKDFTLRRGGREIVKVRWETVTGRLLLSKPGTAVAREIGRLDGHTGPVGPVVFFRDGQRAVTGSWDNSMRLWDLETRQELHRFEGHLGWVWSIAVSPDGRRALSAGTVDRVVRLWDVENGKELGQFKRDACRVVGVGFVGSDAYALTDGGEGDNALRLWDVASGVERHRFEGHTQRIWRACLSPDGRRILSGGLDTTVRLWNVETGEEVRAFKGHTGAVLTVAFSPDGRRVLSAGGDSTIRLWSAETGEEVCRFAGHSGAVESVAFSPGGRRLLSGGHDKTMRLWDIGSAQELQRFEGHTELVAGVAFSRDGRRALSTSADKTVRIWELPK